MREENALTFPIEESGSGVDAGSVALTVGGERAAAAYDEDGGRVVWTPQGDVGRGAQLLRLELTDLAGNRTVWERRVDLAGLVPLPSSYVLHQNHPNPFNPGTVIRFEVPEEAEVRLTIYNMLGQEVQTLLSRRVDAGRYTVTWDGLDARGRAVGAGVYVYRLETRRFVTARKMVLLK
jgi:hypothetical protein